MKFTYQKFTNVTPLGMLEGYQAGALLCLTYLGTVEVNAEHGEKAELLACETIYAKHNADDRPDGRICPSLSMGDVVALQEDWAGGPVPPVRYFACAAAGFHELRDKPVNTTTDLWTVAYDNVRQVRQWVDERLAMEGRADR